MAALYLDSSALVKRYVLEAGSGWVQSNFTPGGDLFASRLAGPEVASALARRLRSGDIDPADAAEARSNLRADLEGALSLVEATAAICSRAMSLAESYALRAVDSIHLATALEVSHLRSVVGLQALVFVSADTTLNAAAAHEGLAVANPNDHA